MASSNLGDQGTTYAAFAQEELAREWSRRSVVDGRAFGILTSSGILTTLTVTLGLWSIKGGRSIDLPGVLGIVAVALFLTAAVLGILASHGRKYKVMHVDKVRARLLDHWSDHEADARSFVAQHQVWTMATLRDGNNTKAKLIAWALWLQLAGLIAVSVAVGIALFR